MQIMIDYVYQSLGLVIEECVIFGLILILNFLLKFFIRKIYKQIQHSKKEVLHESFIKKIVKPIRAMIWIVGIAYMIYTFVNRLELENPLTANFVQIRNAIIVFCSAWLCFALKKQVQLAWAQSMKYTGRPVDQARIDLVSKLSSIFIVVLTILILLQTLGVNITTLVAFGGVGGLAIGFASKDIVANYFSGFMIHVTRPFKVGEWIYTPDHSLEGTVENIGYYLTMVRGFDKRPYYVPNALFSSKMIINASRMSNRRIKHTIGVRYQDVNAVDSIVEEIKTMLQNHPEIDQNHHLLVAFNEYGPSSLNILIYTFTKTKVWKLWLAIQQDVLLKAGKIIEKHGAEIAFPTTTLDLPEEFLSAKATEKGPQV